MGLRYLLSLLPFLLVAGLCGYYTDDLQQDNKESLFLSADGQEDYRSFRETVGEKRVIVLRLNFANELNSSHFTEWRQIFSQLGEQFPEPRFQFLDLGRIYATPGHPLTSFSRRSAFVKNHPKIMLPLEGKQHTGVVILLESDVNHSEISSLISRLLLLEDHSLVQSVEIGGLPYTNYLLNRYSSQIKYQLFPAMFMIALLLTLLLTFSLRASLVLIFPSLLAVSMSMAAVKFFFTDLNMITSIVPLMLFVINLSVAYHIFCTLREVGSFVEAVRQKAVPLGLMILTTSIGFGSLMVSEIPVIRQFALLNTTLILLTCLMNLGWMGVNHSVLLYGGKTSGLLGQIRSRWLAQGLSHRAIAFLLVLIGVGAYYSAGRITVLTDATEYFPKESGIKEALATIEKDFLGNPIFDVLLSKDDGKSFLISDYLIIDDLEKRLQSDFHGRYRIVSANSLVAEAYYLQRGEHVLPHIIPLVRALYERLSGGYTQVFPHKKVYRIALMGSSIDGDQFRRDWQKLVETLTGFGQFHSRIGGLNFNMMRAQDSLLRILAWSFLLSVLIICFLIFLYFRRIALLWVFLIINLFPVFAALIVMDFLDFSLNVATVMTFSISLGMIVDSTLHITYDLLSGKKWHEYFSTTLVPVVASGLLLVVSFLVFGLSHFLPIHQVGIILSVTLLVGLFFDLFILPTLILRRSKYINSV